METLSPEKLILNTVCVRINNFAPASQNIS